MDELSKDNLLRSWKEISAYLGCDVRTCHRWEANHGMPVHRAEGEGTNPPFSPIGTSWTRWFREHLQERPSQP
ncbi:MAG: terminase small subunit [Sphingobacterium sp.]|nr:terminase small subunit [Sphingobacterium sp.]